MAALAAEILQLLAAHAGEPCDYVAVYVFLNTVAGAHYEERYSEAEVRASLRELLASGAVEAWNGDGLLAPTAVNPGETLCQYRLGRAGAA